MGAAGRVSLVAERAQAAGVGVGTGPILAADAAAAADAFGDRLPWCASRPALYARLQTANISLPDWAEARSFAEFEKGLQRLGLPLVVKPQRPGNGAGILRVDHAPDLELAYAKACRYGNRAVLQRLERGLRLTVDAVVYDGAARMASVTAMETGHLPFLFPMALSTPASVIATGEKAIEHVVQRVAAALDVPPGPLSVELTVDNERVSVTDVFLAPSDAAFYGDLIHLASGYDYLGACARAVAGLPVEAPPVALRGAAVAWIPAHAGIVTGLAGLDRAHDIQGVVDVVVNLLPGACLRHATDEITRDLTGYVVATGTDAAEALARASIAAEAIEIVRQPAE
jgi:formate-dependent phosphoribosylglycinamide formyltransferase (GAR transformylase)